MKYDFLISYLDSHNQEGILLSEKLKPREIIYIYENGEKSSNKLDALRVFYKEKFPEMIFNSIELKEISPKEVIERLSNYIKGKSVINLAGSNRLLNIILTHICEKYNVEGLYLEIDKERTISISNGRLEIKRQDSIDLNIAEVIKSFGGSILIESTDTNENKVIKKITSIIADNLEQWESLKYRLYDKRIFINDVSNPNVMRINLEYLTKPEKNICLLAIELLKEYNQIEYKTQEDGLLLVSFNNEYIKGFIFKSGSWLEVYTKDIIAEIKEIDEVKSGVIFLWSDEEIRVKNEIDVMAIKDSELICISCKDSAKYDDVALNELNVYSEKIGGHNVKKILVATKQPLKISVFERAREMGIDIIVFDGDKEKFKKSLKMIVMGEFIHL